MLVNNWRKAYNKIKFNTSGRLSRLKVDKQIAQMYFPDINEHINIFFLDHQLRH